MNRYFYDTYAIIEFTRGNEKYRDYFLQNEGITTLYNAMEVYYILLREEGEEKADKAIEILKPLIVYPKMEAIKESMKFRLRFRKKRILLSYADCLGYVIAKQEKRRFLTGDDAFKGMQNVQ